MAADPFAGYAKPGDVAPPPPAEKANPFEGYAQPPTPVAPPKFVPPVSEKDDPSLWERFNETVADASLSITDTLANVSGLDQQHMEGVEGVERQIGAAEAGLQLAGGAISGVAGIAGDVLAETASELTPEIVKDELARAGRAFGETQFGQRALEIAAEGGEAWSEWAKKHPQKAKSLGAALEVGMLVLPGASNAIKKSGTKMLNKGLNKRVDDTVKILAPDNNIRTRESGGQTFYDKWGTRQYAPGVKAQDVAEEVATVKGFNPKGIAGKGYVTLEDSTSKMAQQLDDAIVKAGNPEVPPTFVDDLSKKIMEFADSEDAILIGQDATNIAQDMLYKVHDMVERSDGTALGLLRVRREFDDWVSDGGQKVFDPSSQSGRNVAQKLIRDDINQQVNALIPDDVVKDSLRKQHLQLTARDRLYDKMQGEGANVFERFMKNFSKGHVGPVGAATIASALGGGLGLTLGSTVAGGAAGGAGLWALYKTWDSATRRKVLGKMIQAAGTSKADKLILIDMLQMEATNQPQTEEPTQ